MSNKIDLSTCDAFELSGIAHATLCDAAGYFYQMMLLEQKQKNPNDLLIQKYIAEHARVHAVLHNSKDALLRDKLKLQIEEFSVYAMKLQELAMRERQ